MFLQDDAYPGWAPNPTSTIVKLTAETIGRVTGKPFNRRRCSTTTFCAFLLCFRLRKTSLFFPLIDTAQPVPYSAGKAPEVKAIHAGLECGIIGEKLPGLDCVSYGPTIRGAHSPDEKVQISTVQPFWQATLEILHQLARRT